MFFRTAFTPSSALFPLFYLFGAWTVNYLFGFISFEYPRQSPLARDAGAAFVLPILTALLWWGQLVSTSFAIKALSHVASHRRRRNTKKLEKIFENIIDTNLKKFRVAILFCAIFIAFNYLYWEGLFAPIENKNHQSFATEALQNRIELLNAYNHKNITLIIIDKYNLQNQTNSTFVEIIILLELYESDNYR